MINYTFIIPHYNSPRLLERCLSSIPERNDIEIIVVDDNSDEDKLPICDRLGARVILDKTSLGAGHARNIGLSASTGKWILFADCDDYYEDGFLNVLDTYLVSSYDIIFFDCYYRYNSLDKKIIENSYTLNLLELKRGSKSNTVANLKHSINAPWNKMYSRRFLALNSILFEEIPIGNDAYFVNLASYLTNNIKFISNKLYYYMDNPSGITRKKMRPLSDLKKVFLSAARVDIIKAQDGAWETIYPVNMKKIKSYIEIYGFSKAIFLYYLKLSYPNYPLWRVYYNKFLNRIKKFSVK